jgi:hypothetical protein
MTLPISARRVFRLSLTLALSLAAAYGLAIPLPYVAPIFALLLTASTGAAHGTKGTARAHSRRPGDARYQSAGHPDAAELRGHLPCSSSPLASISAPT